MSSHGFHQGHKSKRSSYLQAHSEEDSTDRRQQEMGEPNGLMTLIFIYIPAKMHYNCSNKELLCLNGYEQ